MFDGDKFHELTPVPSPVAADDIPHINPYDRHDDTIWFWENAVKTGNVLTHDGVTQIAYHQYKSGTYTALDLALNSTWQYLTDLLPMTMAPNMVTTLGGLHCLLAYVVTWYYSPTFSSPVVPDWVLLLNAYCCAAYYTLDCMDGKQARRTGTSSPLGQLFDHGVDCLCLQQHLSMCMAWLAIPDSQWFWAAQACLQFSFFMAQWEEYYTGILPHATGNVGVTEVNYGLAVACLINAFVPDRAAFYSRAVADFMPEAAFNTMLPLLEFVGMDASTFQLKHALLTGWYIMITGLCNMCLIRVFSAQIAAKQSMMAAFSKLLSPALLCLAPFVVDPVILHRETRWFSLAFGLALTQITIKLIVFSMARQAFAAMQYADVLPLTLASLWIRYDVRWKEPGIRLLMQILTVTYGIRIFLWTAAAIRQICDRLDIYLCTIKPKKKVS
jgi:ethanolaminephosphotransferase